MISRILPAVITIALLSSCSTAYRAQTPDDVYYSPARPQEEYVRVETQKERDAYRYEEENVDDRYLRWKVRNRNRWSGFDDYSNDWYDYRYGYNNSYYTWNRPYYWQNYWSWNAGYNPYCGRVIIVNPKNNAPVYNSVVRTYRPGTYNTTYNNSNNSNTKFKTSPGTYRSSGSYNNSNNSGSLGNSIKKVFNNSNNNSSNNSNSDSRPTRTYSPPTNNSSSNSSGSGSGSGSSGSGSGGGVSRPSRGG
jgi:hypothetical protein